MINRLTGSNLSRGDWRNRAPTRSESGVAYRPVGDARGRIDTWLERRSVHCAMSVLASCAIILGWSIQDGQRLKHPQKNPPPASIPLQLPSPVAPPAIKPPIGALRPQLAMAVVTDTAQKLLYLNLWGSIGEADGGRFRTLVTPYLLSGYVLYRVTISSPGGAMSAAMDIGNQIHTLRGQVRAPLRDRSGTPRCVFASAIHDKVRADDGSLADPDGFGCLCASACSYVWSSGFGREGDVIGVHMFHFSRDTIARWSAAEFRRQTEVGKRTGDDFLARMGMPPGLRAKVWSTPADGLYDLSPMEVDTMSRNTAFAPVLDANCAGSANPAWAPREPAIQSDDPERSICYRKTQITMMRLGAARYLGRLNS